MDTPRPAPICPPRVCLRSPGGRTASRGRQPWEAGVWGVGHGGVLLPRCPGSEAPEGRVAGRAGGSGEGPAGADSPWLYSRWTSRTVCALADLRKRPSERSPAGSAPRVSHGSPHIGIPRRSMTARRRPCRELLPLRLVSPLTTHPTTVPRSSQVKRSRIPQSHLRLTSVAPREGDWEETGTKPDVLGSRPTLPRPAV